MHLLTWSSLRPSSRCFMKPIDSESLLPRTALSGTSGFLEPGINKEWTETRRRTGPTWMTQPSFSVSPSLAMRSMHRGATMRKARRRRSWSFVGRAESRHLADFSCREVPRCCLLSSRAAVQSNWDCRQTVNASMQTGGQCKSGCNEGSASDDCAGGRL